LNFLSGEFIGLTKFIGNGSEVVIGDSEFSFSECFFFSFQQISLWLLMWLSLNFEYNRNVDSFW